MDTNEEKKYMPENVLGCLFVFLLFLMLVFTGIVLDSRAGEVVVEDHSETYDGDTTVVKIIKENFHGPQWWWYVDNTDSTLEELYDGKVEVVGIVLPEGSEYAIQNPIVNGEATCKGRRLSLSEGGLLNERYVSGFSGQCLEALPQSVEGYRILLVSRWYTGEYFVYVEKVEVPVTYSFTVDNR